MSFVVSAVAAALVEGATTAVILTAVSEVGLAMTVVGTITDSKELKMGGMVLGAIGGIGGLANSALGAASAAGDIGAGVAEGSSASAFSDVAGEKFAQNVAGGMDAASAANAVDAGISTASVANPGTDILGSSDAPVSNDILDTSSAQNGAAYGQSLDPTAVAPSPVAPTDVGTTGGNIAYNNGTPTMGAANSLGQTGDINSIGQPNTAGAALNYQAPTTGITNPTPFQTSVGVINPNASKSLFDTLTQSLGDTWRSLKPQSQAEILKMAMSIPGGIQAQSNKAKELALQQQKVNQTSYGSSMPTYGIIAKAKG